MVVKDNCMLRMGEWEVEGTPQGLRSEQGTRSGHPLCMSPVQPLLPPSEGVGFGRVVNKKSGIVCSDDETGGRDILKNGSINAGLQLMVDKQLRK
jgi:hypothetical protein